MASQPEHECQNCKRLQAKVARLEALVGELEERIATLEKNSSNSHKPPSSDIVKPKTDRPRSGKKRSRGAQPGHKRLERTPFSQDEIDVTVSHTLEDGCPKCGGALLPTTQDARVLLQQIGLAPKPVVITEHRAPVYWCPHCQEHHNAQAPKNIRRAGLTGPRIKAFVACLRRRIPRLLLERPRGTRGRHGRACFAWPPDGHYQANQRCTRAVVYRTARSTARDKHA